MNVPSRSRGLDGGWLGPLDRCDHFVRFGFGGSGVRFGLQKDPGFASCGFWMPSFTSIPND